MGECKRMIIVAHSFVFEIIECSGIFKKRR